MTSRRRRSLALTACFLLVSMHSPRTAQDSSASLAAIALDPPLTPTMQCATPGDFLVQQGLQHSDELADGAPMRFDQSPRYLRANHTGDLVFQNFLLVGDHEQVTFERRDFRVEGQIATETWQRTGTQSIRGRLVSVFNPVWSGDAVDNVFRFLHGNDKWAVKFGDIVHPISSPIAAAHEEGHEAAPVRTPVKVLIAPIDIPASETVRIDQDWQYASHVANYWDPDFGDSLIDEGAFDFDLDEIATAFFQQFQKAYDIVAVVSQATNVVSYDGFHRNVKNDIKGIGLDTFDSTSLYGNRGLRAVEFYPPGTAMQNSSMLHEFGHWVSEYSRAWDGFGEGAKHTDT